VRKLASRQAKFRFALKRFKGFWNEFRRSKRGLLGVAIIALYIGVAVLAPAIAPYEPYGPVLPGHYPAGDRPQIAERLAKPIWLKSLPGGDAFSENFFPIQDHTLSTLQSIQAEWNWTSANCTAAPNLTQGQQEDGCIEVVHSPSSDPAEIGYSKIWREFTYPFKDRPQSFIIHVSIFTSKTTAVSTEINIAVNGTAAYTYSVASNELKNNTWSNIFIRSGTSPRLVGTAFPKAGTGYSLQAEITTNANENVTVRLDNFDLLLYGEVFGILGSDGALGKPRDIFSTLIYGTRISLMVGLLSAAVSVVLGLFLGLVSGFVGGFGDELIMRFADFLLVLPTLPLLIVLIVVTQASIWNLILLLSFMGWMGFARQVRSMVLSLRERPFVEAARSVGASTSYIILRHIIPNVFALVYITLATHVPGAIISEASISWLGLFDPSIVSWGRMLYEFTDSGVVSLPFGDYWFWMIPPGIAIMVLAMAFILMGYALDEILNPRLRQRF
jgi:ABC-type dipeptide/oligopeptide/nickel transport system permease subunit